MSFNKFNKEQVEMTEIYRNEIGKFRLIDADAKQQSQSRKKWFFDFESQLRNSYPDLLVDVKIRIVGSVAKELASADSDIDIVLQSKNANRVLLAQVRNAIFNLLNEMKNQGDMVYELDIQELGNPLMFSSVADFNKQNKN